MVTPVIAFTLNTTLSLAGGGGDNDNANHETRRGYNRLKGSGIGIGKSRESFGESWNLARAGRDRVRRNTFEEDDGGKIASPSDYP